MPRVSKVTERIVEAVAEDEIVILRIDNGNFFSLSGTAIAAWRLIDGKRGRSEMTAILASEFPSDQDQIAFDVAELLDQLKDWGIVAED